jgi:hypothetical protein
MDQSLSGDQRLIHYVLSTLSWEELRLEKRALQRGKFTLFRETNYTGLSTQYRLNGALPIAHGDCLRRCFGFAARGGFPKQLQRTRIRARTDEFRRAFASEELILLRPDRDHLFDRVPY